MALIRRYLARIAAGIVLLAAVGGTLVLAMRDLSPTTRVEIEGLKVTFGSTLEEVLAAHPTSKRPESRGMSWLEGLWTGNPRTHYLDLLQEHGLLFAFNAGNRVVAMRLAAGFTGSVHGIRLGSSAETVRLALGEPDVVHAQVGPQQTGSFHFPDHVLDVTFRTPLFDKPTVRELSLWPHDSLLDRTRAALAARKPLTVSTAHRSAEPMAMVWMAHDGSVVVALRHADGVHFAAERTMRYPVHHSQYWPMRERMRLGPGDVVLLESWPEK